MPARAQRRRASRYQGPARGRVRHAV